MTNETVRLVRLAKGMTQKEFAEVLGVSLATIAAVESNRRIVSHKLRTRIVKNYGNDPDVEETIMKSHAFNKLTN